MILQQASLQNISSLFIIRLIVFHNYFVKVSTTLNVVDPIEIEPNNNRFYMSLIDTEE